MLIRMTHWPWRWSDGICSKGWNCVVQEAQYIPGPWLREGKNELVFLEVEKSPSEATGQSLLFPKYQHTSCMCEEADAPL